jgi:hypothetical protein
MRPETRTASSAPEGIAMDIVGTPAPPAWPLLASRSSALAASVAEMPLASV